MRGTISGVYQILNWVTGDCYVGSSCDVEKRCKFHLKSLRGGTHLNKHLQNSFSKYSENFFMFLILEKCEHAKEIILAREQYWIDSLYPRLNNNPLATSNLGMKYSEETRANMSASKTPELRAKVSAKLKGVRLSQETRTKISMANSGKHRSVETLAKISASRKVASIETRAKISAAVIARQTGCHLSPEHRAAVSAGGKGKHLGPLSYEHRMALSKARAGKPLSPEHCLALSISGMGRRHSIETREKMKEAHVGMTGKHHSLESRAKMSDAQKSRWKKMGVEMLRNADN